jgi:ATP-dependent Clp protease ATP-binding subunit ClpC
MDETFSDQTRRLLGRAHAAAVAAGEPLVQVDHLALAVLDEPSVATTALDRLGTKLDTLTARLGTAGPGGPPPSAPVRLSDAASAAVRAAGTEMAMLGQTLLGPEHVLLAIVREDEGLAGETLRDLGVDLVGLRRAVAAQHPDRATPAPSTSPRLGGKGSGHALDDYGTDLTELARQGRLDPVTGRSAEVRRVVQTLCRRSKNNPVLVGDPGVGKTAIVEQLAQEIVAGHVPPALRGARLVTVDVASMLAGARYRGDFEERLLAVLGELQTEENVIAFIDEIHTLVGAGSAEGALDASNILKPLLARSSVRLIGATTVEEYRRHLEKDKALERRLQPIQVHEPSNADVIEILTQLRGRYEDHHGVTITDEAVAASVTLGDRYIPDRYMPDKALDLLDEAGAAVQIDGGSVVDAHDVAEVVGLATGIPVTTASDEESDRLLKLEEVLHQRIVGMDEAIGVIGATIRRMRSGVRDPRRPSGSFVFAGPTGVGKTELAICLAEFLFGQSSELIRLDMSEYSEPSTVARMIGSPPGYVGHEEGGQLTEKVRRAPFSVVLFDEIEKAHPSVFNLLLQVLEDGHLTDAQGRSVDFRNTIIILTTNLGAHSVPAELGFGTRRDAPDAHELLRSQVDVEVKAFFSPELLNRIDEVVVFPRLSTEEVDQIVRIMVDELATRLTEQEITLTVTPQAVSALTALGFDPLLGARPLRRTIQREVEDPLSAMILNGEIGPGSPVVVDAPDDGSEERRITITLG